MVAATPETSIVSLVAPGVSVAFKVPVLFRTTSTCLHYGTKSRRVDCDSIGAHRQIFQTVCTRAVGCGVDRGSGSQVGGIHRCAGNGCSRRIHHGSDQRAADGLGESPARGYCDEPEQSQAERGRF